MFGGKQESVGLCAHVEQDGLHVVLISTLNEPIDLALCRSVDLDCSSEKTPNWPRSWANFSPF